MPPAEHEALKRRWDAVNAELEALAELRTSTHNPAVREGELLEALDEIESYLGTLISKGNWTDDSVTL